MRFSFSFGSSMLSSTPSSPSPSSLPPPPPPPSPNDGLLDITPRKSSFSTSLNSSCAFPSWPNRPSLTSGDSESSASSYLSDEDLFPEGFSSASSEAVIDEESAAVDPVFGAPDLTTEEQIQMMRAAAEEDERRMQYLTHVHARARAQQALRVAQLAAAERENSRRRKRRAVPSKKPRSTSSSSKTASERRA
ncbi:hypothetical protein VTN00DRAFT_3830 [Thermoascus crustaceus]|uniref:uncharacterized protein n=1 Tax=Thermoascus crustaceus TaxID=5088 RepID=UPI003742E047